MSIHALIAGGTGFIGNRMIRHCLHMGYDVTVLSRVPGPRRISWLDLKNYGIPKEVNVVINLAGQNALDPSERWTEGFKQDVWNSRIRTSLALVNAIGEAPDIETFITISGVHHYRPDECKIYNETDKVQSFDFMSKLAVEMENATTLPDDVAKRCRKVILRSGVVLGRNGGMIKSMLLPFQLGLGGPMGTGKQYLPWIHIDDLCRLFIHVLNHDVGEVVNAVAPEIITNGEFSATFAKALLRPCLFAVPEFVLNQLFHEERAVLILTGAKVEPKRALESNFEFLYPTAYDACLQLVKTPTK